MKNTRWLAAALALVTLGMVGSAVAAPEGDIALRRAPQDSDVTPGVGIGKAKLGHSRTQLRATLGKPFRTETRGRGLTEDVWSRKPRADDDFPPHLTITYRNGRAVQIEASSPHFRTRSGINTRTKMGEIRRKHPNLRITEYLYDGARGLFYDDVAAGITFYIGGQDYIMPEYPVESLIVHPRGVRVIPHAGGKPMKLELDKTKG